MAVEFPAQVNNRAYNSGVRTPVLQTSTVYELDGLTMAK